MIKRNTSYQCCLVSKEIFERSSIIDYCIRLKIFHQKINKTTYRSILKKN